MEALASAGGVERLVNIMNDIEDDDTSKKAFATLVQCEEVAVRRLMSSIARVAESLPVRDLIPHSIVQGLATATGRPLPPAHDAVSESVVREATIWLDKCLPVLNGLLFSQSNAGSKLWLCHQDQWLGGLGPLCRLLLATLPTELVVYACFVLVNLTAGPQAKLQEYVARHKQLLDVLVRVLYGFRVPGGAAGAALAADASPSASGVPDRLSDEYLSALHEARSVVYTVLVTLAQGNRLITGQLSKSTVVVQQLTDDLFNVDDCPEAVELFLVLCEFESDNLLLSESVSRRSDGGGSDGEDGNLWDGSESSSPAVVPPLWSPTVGSGGTADERVATDAWVAGARAVQRVSDPKSSVSLRAQQCIAAFTGGSGGRGVGLELWK